MLSKKDARTFIRIAMVAVAVYAGILGGILFYAKVTTQTQDSQAVNTTQQY
mgnify:CR=1 FL=1